MEVDAEICPTTTATDEEEEEVTRINQLEHKFEILGEEEGYVDKEHDDDDPPPPPPPLSEGLMERIKYLEDQVSAVQRNQDLLYHAIGRITALENRFKKERSEWSNSISEIRKALRLGAGGDGAVPDRAAAVAASQSVGNKTSDLSTSSNRSSRFTNNKSANAKFSTTSTRADSAEVEASSASSSIRIRIPGITEAVANQDNNYDGQEDGGGGSGAEDDVDDDWQPTQSDQSESDMEEPDRNRNTNISTTSPPPKSSKYSSSSSSSIKCALCPKEFKSKKHLAAHQFLHAAGIDSFQCNSNSCELTFSSFAKLTRHMKNSHQQESTNPPPPVKSIAAENPIIVLKDKDANLKRCSSCGRKLASYTLLVKHWLNIHNKIARYECGSCKKLFENKAELMGHGKRCKASTGDDDRQETEEQEPEPNSSSPVSPTGAVEEDRVSTDSTEAVVAKLSPLPCEVLECELVSSPGIPDLPPPSPATTAPAPPVPSTSTNPNLNAPPPPNKLDYTKAKCKCTSCPKEFISERQLRTHLHREHLDSLKKFKCKLCSRYSFYTAQLLAEHYTSVHKPPRDENGQVTTSATLSSTASGSSADLADRECPQCGKIVSAKRHLSSHLRKVHSIGVRLSCEFCDQSFVLRDQLKTHQLAEHGKLAVGLLPGKRMLTKPKVRYSCSNCGKEFSDKARLKEHSPGCHGLKPFQCEQCGRSYTRERHLKDHSKLVHGGVPHEEILCPECGKSIRKNNYRGHLQSHRADPCSYKCQMCERTFKFKRSLVQHENLHSLERNFGCTFCDKKFKLNKDLLCHLRLHTGKPFVCDLCGWTFSRPYLLANHKLCHELGTNRTRMHGDGTKKKRVRASRAKKHLQKMRVQPEEVITLEEPGVGRN